MSELPVKKSRIEKELNEEFLKTEEVKIPGTPRERGEEGLKHKREAVELLRDVMSYQSDDLSRYRLASAIYRQNWDKPLHGKTFGEVTLEDFAAFDKAGLTHRDLSRMKQAPDELDSGVSRPLAVKRDAWNLPSWADRGKPGYR
jgi:hypothetical protein